MRLGPIAMLAMLGLAACQAAPPPPPPAPPPPLPAPQAAPLPPPECPRAQAYEEGVASWYGSSHHGKTTASGAPFDMHALTAAHRRLALGTRIRVTSLASGRQVELEVNDRGPFIRGRVLDVSQRAAQLLGFVEAGTIRVRIETLTPC